MTERVSPVRLSTAHRQSKLQQLADLEGIDSMEMLRIASADSIVPAICIHTECDYTASMEPDQDRGWCPECNENTMQSCLILMGLAI